MGCGSSVGPAARGVAAGVISEVSDAPKKAELPPTVLVDEPELDGPQDETVPSYWTNKRHADQALFSQMVYVSQAQHSTFDSLLKDSYEAKSTKDRPCPKPEGEKCERQSQGCPCVRVDGTPGLPTAFCVRRVVRVENSAMWARYAKRRAEITANRSKEKHIHHFDPFLMTNECVKNHNDVFERINWRMNECYLWHGTHVRTALSIATQDFDMQKAGTGRGAMYGPGAYFAESCTKADEYAFDESGGYYDGIHAMLLCRICMGKMFYTSKFGVEEAADKVKEGEFDSCLGDLAKRRMTFREFVVYNADQIYPEYVVLYQRVHRADNIADIREIAATPFHLELPVYWRNCHKVPANDEFDEQCRLRHVTCELLQGLASGTSKREVNLVTARRIENSKLWTQYVAFKAKVRTTLLDGDVVQPALKKSSRCISASAMAGGSDSVATANFLKGQEDCVEESISVDNLDSPLNEHLLWYGACHDEIRAMAHLGLDITRGCNHPEYARYGQGLYLSETLDRVLDFAEEDENGIKYMLLCRVCCGEFAYTEAVEDQDAVNGAKDEGKHTVLANPEKSGRREFVCLENTQIYPEFILELKVVGEPEPVSKGDDGATAEEEAPAAEQE